MRGRGGVEVLSKVLSLHVAVLLSHCLFITTEAIRAQT